MEGVCIDAARSIEQLHIAIPQYKRMTDFGLQDNEDPSGKVAQFEAESLMWFADVLTEEHRKNCSFMLSDEGLANPKSEDGIYEAALTTQRNASRSIRDMQTLFVALPLGRVVSSLRLGRELERLKSEEYLLRHREMQAYMAQVKAVGLAGGARLAEPSNIWEERTKKVVDDFGGTNEDKKLARRLMAENAPDLYGYPTQSPAGGKPTRTDGS